MTDIPNALPIWGILLIPLAFTIIFPLFWCFTIWIISLMSGWRRLAKEYPVLQPPSGKAWREQTVFVKQSSYKRMLTLTTNAEGMFIEVMWLFRFGHPPLFIPWHKFHFSDSRVFIFRKQRYFCVEVAQPPLATMRLPAVVFEGSEGRKLIPDSMAVEPK